MSVHTIRPRDARVYTIAEAARLARTSPGNIRNWLRGSSRPGRRMKPVLAGRGQAGQPTLLTFVEVAVVARHRDGSGRTVPLKRLREAHAFARRELGLAHPFASQRFSVEGGHIIHDFDEAHPGARIALDLEGVFVLPLEFSDEFKAMDFDPGDGLALRWHPAGRAAPIDIDPSLGAGRPVIEGRNLRVQLLADRLREGWTIEEIADDYALPNEVVLRALQHVDAA
jgi:uncharacterized protein (DUF433 family)